MNEYIEYISIVHSVHHENGRTSVSHTAILDKADGECDILADCGIHHTPSNPYGSPDLEDCPVASRWTILRAMAS